MKYLQNAEIDVLVFLECIYPRLTTDNTAVSPIGPMGAGKLRAGVRVRALRFYNKEILENRGTQTKCHISALRDRIEANPVAKHIPWFPSTSS